VGGQSASGKIGTVPFLVTSDSQKQYEELRDLNQRTACICGDKSPR
jgi:hypothetical protein